jgi:hypothetical protein
MAVSIFCISSCTKPGTVSRCSMRSLLVPNSSYTKPSPVCRCSMPSLLGSMNQFTGDLKFQGIIFSSGENEQFGRTISCIHNDLLNNFLLPIITARNYHSRSPHP